MQRRLIKKKRLSATKRRRRAIPTRIVALVMRAVDMRCCLCEWRTELPPRCRGQVHHIDGNPSNNRVSNLVWLCLTHHEEVGSKGQSTRRLPADAVREYRHELQDYLKRQREAFRIQGRSETRTPPFA